MFILCLSYTYIICEAGCRARSGGGLGQQNYWTLSSAELLSLRITRHNLSPNSFGLLIEFSFCIGRDGGITSPFIYDYFHFPIIIIIIIIFFLSALFLSSVVFSDGMITLFLLSLPIHLLILFFEKPIEVFCVEKCREFHFQCQWIRRTAFPWACGKRGRGWKTAAVVNPWRC